MARTISRLPLRVRVLAVLVLLLATGLLPSGAATTLAQTTTGVCVPEPLTFSPPVRLGSGFGYEPGLEVDSQGTIYVTAHKADLLVEPDGGTAGRRLSSFLYRSVDGGKTWLEMDGLVGATRAMFAFEGDIAIDAKDRMYYVDTALVDNHFYRFSDRGATLDMYRPALPSSELVDDRPWVAAHGDGYVYYMSNSVGAGPKLLSRLVVHRSTDGGQTFDPVGHGFPNSLWGFLDADPNSPYVYAFMDETSGNNLVSWVSPDRGQTWTKHVAATYEIGSSDNGFPNVAVSPKDGSVYAIWNDGNRKIKLARSIDHGATWTTYDISPFSGTYGFPWVDVAPNGDVGIVFEADPPGGPAGSFVYGMIWRPQGGCLMDPADPASACTDPSAVYARLQQTPAGSRVTQADFFQGAFGPDNRFYASWADWKVGAALIWAGGPVMFGAQSGGPNLSGQLFCGLHGRP